MDVGKKSRKKKSEREKASNGGEGNQESNTNRKVPKWKLENKDGNQTLEQSGKTYYWCMRHNNNKGMWVLHKPHQCRNCPNKSEEEEEKADACNKQEQAMPTIIEDDRNKDSDSDESEAP